MKHKGPANPERSFGLSVGGVLLLVSAYQWWRGSITVAEVLAVVGAVLVTCGYLQPRLLKWPSALWWKFALILGYINARVILTIIFALVLIPIGFVWRLIGRDPLTRRRTSWHGWSSYPPRYRDPKHYERMY